LALLRPILPHPASTTAIIGTPSTQREDKLRETGRGRDHNGNVSDGDGWGAVPEPAKKVLLFVINYSFSVVDSKNRWAGGHRANFTPLNDGWKDKNLFKNTVFFYWYYY
jgi:hypothetical protein